MRKTFPPLLILRHGETEWNAQGRLQGRFDSPLTARGRAQALAQRRLLAGRDLSGYRAVSSPQGRAFDTAAIALVGLVPDIETDARLREIGLGEWAGLARQDALERTTQSGAPADPFQLYEAAPGGEGFDALARRCAAFLQSLRQPAVLVTHGITSRMLRLQLLGLGLEDLARLPGGQGVIFQIEDGRQRILEDSVTPTV